MEIALTSKQIVTKQNLITSLSLDSKTIIIQLEKSQEGEGRGGQGSVGELIILWIIASFLLKLHSRK